MKYKIKALKKIGFSVKQFFLLFTIASILIMYVQLTGLQDLEHEQKLDISRNITTDVDQANRLISNYIKEVKSLMLTLSTRDDIFTLPANEAIKKLSLIIKNYSTIDTLLIKRDDGSIICDKQVMYEVFGKKQIGQIIDGTNKEDNIITQTSQLNNSL